MRVSETLKDVRARWNMAQLPSGDCAFGDCAFVAEVRFFIPCLRLWLCSIELVLKSAEPGDRDAGEANPEASGRRVDK